MMVSIGLRCFELGGQGCPHHLGIVRDAKARVPGRLVGLVVFGAHIDTSGFPRTITIRDSSFASTKRRVVHLRAVEITSMYRYSDELQRPRFLVHFAHVGLRTVARANVCPITCCAVAANISRASALK